MSKITGIVLCGGQSSRMGQDKGLLEYSGKTWAENVYGLLVPLCDAVRFSVRSEQLAAYKRALPVSFQKRLLVDQHIAAGPLRGILSTWQKLRTDLLVLPADMPSFPSRLLGLLMQAMNEHPDWDAACYQSGSVIEPFPSYWTHAFVEAIYRSFADSSSAQPPLSVQRLLVSGNTGLLQVQKADAACFRSWNTPADWQTASL